MFRATAAWACGVLAVPRSAGSAGAFAAWAAVRRVHDDLIAAEVRPGVVQDVPVPLCGQDADQGGDEDAEADGGEGRARAGPVAGQVAQGQACRDRGPPAETGQHHQAEGRQQDDRDDERDEAENEFRCSAAVGALAGVRQQGRGDHEEDHAGHRRAVDLLRRSRAPGQGGDDREPGDRAGRARGGEVGGHHGQRHRRADHVPRQLEHADQVVSTGFQARPVGQPDGQAEHRPDDRAHDSHQDAVDPDHEADVPVGGAQGAEHPERAQPALGQHREPAHRDQGDEQHAHRGQPEHDGLGVERVAGRRRLPALEVRAEGGGGHPGRVEQDGDLGRRADLARHDERELIQQALRVLHDAGDLASSSRPGARGRRS